MVVLGAVAGLAVGSLGTTSSVSNESTVPRSAEQVAARFVVSFESYSPSSSPSAGDAVLATGKLASMLDSRPGSGPADTLAEEGYRVRAAVEGIEVAGESASSVELLVETELTVSDSAGSSSSSNDIPVTLSLTRRGWRVTEAGGIGAVPSPLSVPAASSAPSRPEFVAQGSTRSSPAGSDTRNGSGLSTVSATTPDPTGAVGDIPAQYVALFEAAAAAECPSMSWTILAGIAKVESDFGESTLPGVRSGANSAGAEGPMQFEPATFAEYAVVAPGGADPASPYDPADAVYSAAHLLCANGAGNPATLYDAIFDYNHSASYVQLVMTYAAQYSDDAAGGGSASTVLTSTEDPARTVPGDAALASVIIADAQAYLGTPYVWGGENPKVGFDCSGLVQWVFAEAGLHLPRVAQDQYDYGPILPEDAELDPGDLVFFGGGPEDVEHVGIYVGHGEMIDAPYTGAVVRYDVVADVPLGFVGATRPETPNIGSVNGLPTLDEEVTEVPNPSAAAPSGKWHQSATSSRVPPHDGGWTPPAGGHAWSHGTGSGATLPPAPAPAPAMPYAGQYRRTHRPHWPLSTSTTTSDPPSTSTTTTSVPESTPTTALGPSAGPTIPDLPGRPGSSTSPTYPSAGSGSNSLPSRSQRGQRGQRGWSPPSTAIPRPWGGSATSPSVGSGSSEPPEFGGGQPPFGEGPSSPAGGSAG